MTENETIIAQTKKWITDVVIGCNFCPFAPKVLKQKTIHYVVEKSDQIKETLTSLLNQCVYLDDNQNIETTLLILPGSYQNFDDYLRLVSQAERLIKKKGYEGIYQVASFHPLYVFADSAVNDPANFTNRSPYPMLHILREEGIEEALLNYPHPEKIPENNVKFAREKGYDYMKNLRDDCLKI
jgi:hypothetical protein